MTHLSPGFRCPNPFPNNIADATLMAFTQESGLPVSSLATYNDGKVGMRLLELHYLILSLGLSCPSNNTVFLVWDLSWKENCQHPRMRWNSGAEDFIDWIQNQTVLLSATCTSLIAKIFFFQLSNSSVSSCNAYLTPLKTWRSTVHLPDGHVPFETRTFSDTSHQCYPWLAPYCDQDMFNTIWLFNGSGDVLLTVLYKVNEF